MHLHVHVQCVLDKDGKLYVHAHSGTINQFAHFKSLS